mmetsp:Transcript_11900/g.28197  ORF Transcript_11900/g.28197 Transcript_11900/m.28197 type:complete len:682 (-) Transcript_11900:1275-3320(-)|eukprot:CAMPEP_0197194168 /NCGR_PEP_ID=MMETSP1423-20130617/28724_1 /TAXON_ID=476441 /ORGANISM="Pseudo-nitzschia heimii, Strain UNC1101" /LENGTH=681 /DNA_ID=CAMNT_0042647543 /DNA_START=229 /DNA_END=2274 /DNA_ORIENTATION=+
MQRIISGDGIHGIPKNSSSIDRNKKETSTRSVRSKSPKNEPMLSHSPSVTFDDVANFVENDGESYNGGVTLDAHKKFGKLVSEASITCPQSWSREKPVDDTYVSQGHSPTSPSLSINGDDNSSCDNKKDCSVTQQRQLQTPLSLIGGLLPNAGVGLLPISRNDSKNFGTNTSVGSGLQRSQNSSRDWGWFEDVHHSDQGVTSVTVSNGGVIGSTRTGGKNGGKKRTTLGGSVTSSAGNRTSLPQHQQMNAKVGNAALSSGVSFNNDGNGRTCIDGLDSRAVGRNDEENHYGAIDREGDSRKDTKSNKGNRLRLPDRGEININTASLLPTGDEMLIDETQEYLEPIHIHPRPRDMENAAVQAVTAPNYVLEESLSNQLLWKNTAGNRPPQPVEERAFFEAQWAENFALSEVEYRMPTEVLTATTPVSLNPFADGNFGTDGTGVIGPGGTPVADVGGARVGRGNTHNVADIVSSFVVPGGTNGHNVASSQHNPYLQNHHRVAKSGSGSGVNLIVYAKGDNVFGTTVSKSFAKPSFNGELVSGVDTVNISIASYRVVESEKRGKHAQFLVIYREGSIRDTIGVWKRYSDFQELSNKVTRVHEGCASVIANMSPLAITEEHDVEHLPNAITSWHLLKKRKRWYRCLDTGYLSLKAFLLERFLHDILFESSTPDLLRDFVGVPPPR